MGHAGMLQCSRLQRSFIHRTLGKGSSILKAVVQGQTGTGCTRPGAVGDLAVVIVRIRADNGQPTLGLTGARRGFKNSLERTDRIAPNLHQSKDVRLKDSSE